MATYAKDLLRRQGLVDGDGRADSSLYFDHHGVVIDALGRNAGAAAFLVRGIDPVTGAPTELFRVDKDGQIGQPAMSTPALANQLTNPAFELWTRGSGPFTGDLAFSADAWQFLKGGTSTISITPETTVVATGSGKALKASYVQGSAVSQIDQKLEALTQLRGRTLTFAIDGVVGVSSSMRPFLQDSGVRYYGTPATSVGAYQTLTVTHAIGAAATVVRVGVELSTTDTIYLDNATLTIGSVVQAFAPLPPDLDASRAQRRYQKLGPAPTFPHFAGYQGAGLTIALTLLFPTQMASVPTLTVGGVWSYTNASALTADSATVDGCRILLTATALGNALAFSNSSGYLEFESNP